MTHCNVFANCEVIINREAAMSLTMSTHDSRRKRMIRKSRLQNAGRTMNKMKCALVTVLIVCMAATLCSCGLIRFNQSRTITSTPKEREADAHRESEPAIELLTSEELLQIIRDNDTGVTEDDFEGIDIDDFIAFCRFQAPSKLEDTRLHNLRPHLDRYLNHLEMELYDTSQYLALEKMRVDSTDEEYETFIEAYFKALDMEYEALGISSRDELDVYHVYADGEIRDFNNRYYLYIGRTMDIRRYKIEGDGPFLLYKKSGFFEITESMNIYYNKDYKFFLCTTGPNSGPDVYYKIIKTFAEVTY